MINSTIIIDAPQIDNRRFIREQHIDDFGKIVFHDYIAEQTDNVSIFMSNRVAQLEAQSIQNELEQLLDTLPEPPTLQYATISQAGAFIRNKYKDATSLEVGRIAGWLLNRTDNQLKNAFNINDAQLVVLKLNLQDAKDKYIAAQAMEGE